MTKFEQIGVNFQHDSVSKSGALKSFQYSCNVCCSRGMRIDCDHCAIRATHEMVVATFEEVSEHGEV